MSHLFDEPRADPPRPDAPVPPAPTTRAELAQWVERTLGIRIPDRAVCPNHQAPLDYLTASFLNQAAPSDLLVWANRGGGKTLLAAVASLLEAMYRAPVNIRILGGSFDQSDRLADYLRQFLSGKLSGLLSGRMTRQRIRLSTGADIRMLSQSQRAVRGQHVQRIRCDEVDLFDPEIWQALQFVTRSSDTARGSVEVFSTLHRPGGLMEKLVNSADGGQDRSDPAHRPAPAGFRLFKWCLWEVIERCPQSRRCGQCPLWPDCRGRARQANGFFRIDDAIAIRARSSRASWEAEMLCKGPAREHLVFGEFDPAAHVCRVEYGRELPTYRAIDFGYAAPFVCLWIQLTPGGEVRVLDEYVRSRRPITHHAAEILRRDPGGGGDSGRLGPPVVATYVDPAGRAREATSGAACTELLAAAGIPCSWRASTIAEGLELIRAALAPAGGPARLKIHPRCRRLIDALRSYHYPAPGSNLPADVPVKDGPDHLIDALRYFFVNRMRPAGPTRRGAY